MKLALVCSLVMLGIMRIAAVDEPEGALRGVRKLSKGGNGGGGNGGQGGGKPSGDKCCDPLPIGEQCNPKKCSEPCITYIEHCGEMKESTVCTCEGNMWVCYVIDYCPCEGCPQPDP